MKSNIEKNAKLFVVTSVVLVALLGYGAWEYRTLKAERQSFEERIVETTAQLQEAGQNNLQLTEALVAEKTRVNRLAEQVEEITGTVGILEKLQETDEELLQKYSRVSFLNEHYVPQSLTEIPNKWLAVDDDEDNELHTKVWPHLKNLLKDAEEDEVALRVVSAFRSFSEQSQLKSQYRVIYGSGANTFSADQGFSEHQLGTAVDFSTPALSSQLDGFENTKAYEWLQKNAYKYGFILSYPPDNRFYVFEPWHWRFVGEDLAQSLHETDQNFYDLPQREISEYLVNIFD